MRRSGYSALHGENPDESKKKCDMELWNIQDPSIIAAWRIFRTLSCLQK